MNICSLVASKLGGYSKHQMVISSHARIRMVQRGIEAQEILHNLLDPKRLMYATRLEAKKEGEEKFD